jgi:circadian clock protein KaiB
VPLHCGHTAFCIISSLSGYEHHWRKKMNSRFSELPERDEWRARYKFRLYVVPDTLDGSQALANLTALCDAYLPDRYEIEVVNVIKEPKRALADGILMTPTLIKLSPEPSKKNRWHPRPDAGGVTGIGVGTACSMSPAKPTPRTMTQNRPTARMSMTFYIVSMQSSAVRFRNIVGTRV